MSIEKKDIEAKLDELEKSKAGIEDNLKAHLGAIQVLKQLLDDDKELAVPVEQE